MPALSRTSYSPWSSHRSSIPNMQESSLQLRWRLYQWPLRPLFQFCHTVSSPSCSSQPLHIVKTVTIKVWETYTLPSSAAILRCILGPLWPTASVWWHWGDTPWNISSPWSGLFLIRSDFSDPASQYPLQPKGFASLIFYLKWITSMALIIFVGMLQLTLETSQIRPHALPFSGCLHLSNSHNNSWLRSEHSLTFPVQSPKIFHTPFPNNMGLFFKAMLYSWTLGTHFCSSLLLHCCDKMLTKSNLAEGRVSI